MSPALRYRGVAITLSLVVTFTSCTGPTKNDPGPEPIARKLPVVLRPVAAALQEKGGPVVDPVVTRIKPKADVPYEFKAAQFVGEKTGWASTDKFLYRTSDAGKTWERLPFNTPEDAHIYAFFFIDENRGWLAEVKRVYAERYGSGNSSRILVTDDGGRSWSEQASFPNEAIIAGVRFRNLNEGLAIGTRVADKGPPYQETLVLSTSDGGKTWSDISESVNVSLKSNGGIAGGYGSDIHWSATAIHLLTTSGRVTTSTDQGKTWKTTVEFHDERPNGLNSSTGYLKLLMDPRQRIRVLAGGRGDEGYWGDLVVNDDHGGWTSYELDQTPILDAIFLSDNEILACGEGVPTGHENSIARAFVGILLYSQDTGKTWFPIYRSRSSESFITLARVGENTFYAVSDAGTFLRFNLPGK